MQFCLSIKVLFQLPLRQTAGMVARLLKLAGLDWPVPDFSPSAAGRKPWPGRSPAAAQMARYTGSWTAPLSGFSAMANGRAASTGRGADGEPCRAIGPSDNGERRKVHLAMDTATSGIHAVEFTPGHDGDRPVRPDLPGKNPEDEQIGAMTAPGRP